MFFPPNTNKHDTLQPQPTSMDPSKLCAPAVSDLTSRTRIASQAGHLGDKKITKAGDRGPQEPDGRVCMSQRKSPSHMHVDKNKI